MTDVKFNSSISAIQPSQHDTAPELGVGEGKEDGRTFHNTSAAYVLPNDNVEHERLERQHRILWPFMGNKVLHAPLEKSNMGKMLDIGCGTGAVTHEMAALFPDAQVVGVDLSQVPTLRQKLPNIIYVQGNIMDSSEARFERDSFDLVFSRFLVMGMSNWKGYVERCVSLTKPGGWVEMQDFSMAVHSVPEHVSSLPHLRPHSITMSELENTSHPTDAYHHRSPWLWETTWAKLLALKDADFYCGTNLASLFAGAGLVDIKVKRYMAPFSRWEGLTAAERALSDHLEQTFNVLTPLGIRKAGENAGPAYAREVEAAVRDANQYSKAWEGGRTFLWLYVVCGRKPE